MGKKTRWITQTAVLLALLIVLQAVTKAFGQLVTGSCVNTVLAIATLFVGMSSGVTIAVISPVLAFVLGIAPQAVTVPAIMVGNACFVVLLNVLYKESVVRKIVAVVVAAAVKCAVLYVLVAKIICGLASASLLASGALKEPMLKMLPTMFAWPQLFTALIGGTIAVLLVPVLKKALKQ